MKSQENDICESFNTQWKKNFRWWAKGIARLTSIRTKNIMSYTSLPLTGRQALLRTTVITSSCTRGMLECGNASTRISSLFLSSYWTSEGTFPLLCTRRSIAQPSTRTMMLLPVDPRHALRERFLLSQAPSLFPSLSLSLPPSPSFSLSLFLLDILYEQLSSL